MTIILVICFLLLAVVSKQLDKNDEFINEYIDLIYTIDHQDCSKIENNEYDLNNFISQTNEFLFNQIESTETLSVVGTLIEQIVKSDDCTKIKSLDSTVVWADPFELSKAYMLTVSLQMTSPNSDKPLNQKLSIFIRTKQKDKQVSVTYMKWTLHEEKKKDI